MTIALKEIHISNEKKRDANVRFVSLIKENDPKLAYKGKSIKNSRLLISSNETSEESLIKQEVDCCVHSAKDMATERTEGTEVLGVVWQVGDRRDALVGPFENFDSIPSGQRIGTSSPRRADMLQDQRKDLRFVPIRGNIETRLKLVGKEVDAIIMAKCALDRLKLNPQHTVIPEEELLPAAGQGKVVVQVRSDDTKMKNIWAPEILEWPTFEYQAEKYLLELVGGDCHTAIGVTADARPEKGLLQIRCSYHNGKNAKHIQEIGPIAEWKKVVHNTVVQLELQ